MDINHFRPLLAWILIVSLLTPTITLASAPDAAPWPQWRGPTRDGQIVSSNWPDSLNANILRKTWFVPLGPSYSGPIVSEDRVFVTETMDKKYEVVRALDRASGKQIWHRGKTPLGPFWR